MAEETRSGQSSVIETRTSKLWLEPDGILRGVLKPGAKEQLEDAKANVAAAAKIAEDGGREQTGNLV